MELNGWKYYKLSKKGESIKDCVRRILIQEIEYYIRYKPDKLKKFIEWATQDKEDRQAIDLYLKCEANQYL